MSKITNLENEIKTIFRMVDIMKPQSEGELFAVSLPNLHIKIFGLIAKAKKEGAEEERERINDWLQDPKNDTVGEAKKFKRGTHVVGLMSLHYRLFNFNRNFNLFNMKRKLLTSNFKSSIIGL